MVVAERVLRVAVQVLPVDEGNGALDVGFGDSDNWNEDNSRIRTGHGPENMTGLRRFASA